MVAQILIIEDNELQLGIYSRILKSEGYAVFGVGSIRHAREFLQKQIVQVVILDVQLPDGNGLEFISELRTTMPDVEIIIFTSNGSIEDGIKSIKFGAFDYLIKSDSPTKLISIVDRAKNISYPKLLAQLERAESNEKSGFSTIIGQSDCINKAKNMAIRVAETNANVLLLGETGVGKDLFAEAIHYSSKRNKYPFIAINCSSISDEMLESELFGYKAGAFTGAIKDKKGLFEVADKGTIFLDEIGEMGLLLQSRILRVLQNRSFIKLGDVKTTKIDCRLISATNIDLLKSVQKGGFREDLYYRISSFVIKIPPLRERTGDLKLLINHFSNILPEKLGKGRQQLTTAFISALTKQQWKGNVRELINVMERAIILSDDVLNADILDFPKHRKQDLYSSLERVEIEHIKDTLKETGGNKRETARRLGISITTLYRRLGLKNDGLN